MHRLSKEERQTMSDFIAFNQNALNNLIYLFTSNIWNLIFLVAMVGTVILRIRNVIDEHVEEHVGII